MCAAYDRDRVLPLVGAALDRGVRAVKDVLGEVPGARYVEEGELRYFGEPEWLLSNVNSPEDLQRARLFLGDARGDGG